MYILLYFSLFLLHLPGELTEEKDEKDVAGGDGDAGDQRHPGRGHKLDQEQIYKYKR